METALSARAAGMISAGDTIRMLAHGGRTAVVTAPGGHFSTVAAAARFQLDHPGLGRRMRVCSIYRPLPELVDKLNRFNPAVLSGFLGMLTVLAAEQDAGRLRIRPALVMPGGETLTTDTRGRLAAAFGAKVRAASAATECSFLAIGCAHGWYHVNSDWALLEPVDADGRPTPPGELSHTVLLSNLANRVQPFLRYDLGDSVLLRPDRCPCGSVFPAVQVQGRAADLLTFPTGDAELVAISPMLFGTLLDRIPGIGQYQLVQSAPSTLRVRLRSPEGADPDPAVADRARGGHPPPCRAHGRRRQSRTRRRTTAARTRRHVPPGHSAHPTVSDRIPARSASDDVHASRRTRAVSGPGWRPGPSSAWR